MRKSLKLFLVGFTILFASILLMNSQVFAASVQVPDASSTKTTQELEEVYNFFSNIGFTNFSEFPTIISYSNIDEIQEIAKYIVKNIEAPLANKLLKSPTVFTTNFKMLKSSLTFIKENNLTSELEEKPYVLSEAKKDKMDRNKAFLTKTGLTNLASNIIILARGNIENMEKIIEYFSSNNILDLLDKCPTLLTKKYKNVVACIEYFKSQDKMDVVYSTPSLALVKVTELESVGKDIKEAGLEEIAQASPIMYRAKNIKNNSKLVKKETFKGTAGVASVYSTATSKLNDRKKYFDENGLTWLYEKCPSLLSEGNVDTIDESYKCLVELGMEKILDKAPSILTRLKGRDAIINRVNHLYSLGITKEEIIFSSTMLTRYSDEEVLSKVNYYRNKKSGR